MILQKSLEFIYVLVIPIQIMTAQIQLIAYTSNKEIGLYHERFYAFRISKL